MAPRQLFSQPMEDENDPEPGSKQVRVGECLVGRHGSDVAVDVERCAVFGAVHAGSVLLPGFCVVDRWVGHDCFTCACSVVCAPTR
eukprot:scaffold1102_cov116-Isochrysis_galbana.AAC.2